MPKHGPKGNPHNTPGGVQPLPPWIKTLIDAANKGRENIGFGAEGLGNLGLFGLNKLAQADIPREVRDFIGRGPGDADTRARNALYNLLAGNSFLPAAGQGGFPQPGDLLQGAGGAIQGLFPPGQQSANPVAPLPANNQVDTFADDDTIFFGPGVGRNEREGKIKDIQRDIKIDNDIQSLRDKLQQQQSQVSPGRSNVRRSIPKKPRLAPRGSSSGRTSSRGGR